MNDSLPIDEAAEQQVIGSLILDQTRVDDVALILTPEDFFFDEHAAIYRNILRLHNAGKIIGGGTGLLDAIRHDPSVGVAKFKASNYPLRIGACATSVAVAEWATMHAKVVRDRARRRRLIEAASEALNEAYAGELDGDVAISNAYDRMGKLAEMDVAAEPKSIGDLAKQVRRDIDSRAEGVPCGIKTGWKMVDGILGSLRAGQLIVVAARPGMGKTSMAMNLAVGAAKGGNSTLVFSLEMEDTEVTERMMSGDASVDLLFMRNAGLREQEDRRVNKVIQEYQHLPMKVLDVPNLSMIEIGTFCRMQKRKGALDLVIVDYLQLIKAQNPKDPRERQVSQIVNDLKNLARNLGVPIVVAAQLNRQNEAATDKTPKLSQIRESGSIEQDADVVIFVHRPGYYTNKDDGRAQFIIAKNRNGPLGIANMVWHAKVTKFEDEVVQETQTEAF